MSYTEFHFGRMKEVTLPETQTIEDFFKEKSGKEELKSYNDSWEEQYRDDTSEEAGTYISLNNKIYEILEHQENDDDEYYMKLIKNSDGTITFIGSFYNGGTCFREMLEASESSL